MPHGHLIQGTVTHTHSILINRLDVYIHLQPIHYHTFLQSSLTSTPHHTSHQAMGMSLDSQHMHSSFYEHTKYMRCVNFVLTDWNARVHSDRMAFSFRRHRNLKEPMFAFYLFIILGQQTSLLHGQRIHQEVSKVDEIEGAPFHRVMIPLSHYTITVKMTIRWRE